MQEARLIQEDLRILDGRAEDSLTGDEARNLSIELLLQLVEIPEACSQSDGRRLLRLLAEAGG